VKQFAKEQDDDTETQNILEKLKRHTNEKEK
jgi:hypothetical protein